MRAAIAKARAPFAEDLAHIVGTTESLLFRRGNFNGTFDDLICAALLKERDAEIALISRIPLGHERSARPGESQWKTSTTPRRSPIRRSIACP